MKLLATNEDVKGCLAGIAKLELKLYTLFLSKDEYGDRLLYHNQEI